MAILKTCCCLKSVRSGSFACGIYTLVFHTVIITAGTFHVDTVLDQPALAAFGSSMFIFSGLCVISSVLLLVGLCVDNRKMLLPWIVAVSMTTLLDIVVSFYFISDLNAEPFGGLFFAIDYFTCALNIYCILCVISQYQEYLAGRGGPDQYVREQISPYDSHQLPAPKPSFIATDNNYTNSCCLNVPTGGTTPRTKDVTHERQSTEFSHDRRNEMTTPVPSNLQNVTAEEEPARNEDYSRTYCNSKTEDETLANCNNLTTEIVKGAMDSKISYIIKK